MKKIIILLLVVLVAMPPQARGMVVSDPTSYGYYVEQLKEMAKQTKEAMETVRTLGGIRTTAEDLYDSTVGTYNRGMSMVRQVQRLQKKISSEPSTLDGQFRKWSGVVDGVAGLGNTAGRTADGAMGVYVDARQVLDENFEDPRKRKTMMARVPNMSKDRQYHVSQSALKDAVAATEDVLQTMPERIGTLEELANAIDTTKNTKDAADLQNRFLAEILKTLYELLAVVSRIGEAQSLQFYQGVDDATMEQRIEATKRAAEREPEWIHDEQLNAAGVSRVDGFYRAGSIETIINR